MHRIPTNSLTCDPSISGVFALGFDSEFQQYTNGSALGVQCVLFQSASCGCPGRAGGRGRKSWMLKNVTFTLDADPHPRAPSRRALMRAAERFESYVPLHRRGGG